MAVSDDAVCILGLDPGLRFTGWGVIDATSSGVQYKGHGIISVPSSLDMPKRLNFLFEALRCVLVDVNPQEVAIEEVFVNKNGASTLKLCMARGVALLAPATLAREVFEYSANCVKKTITGDGHASKDQVEKMVKHFLPDFLMTNQKQDCSDALAIAICHAHHRAMQIKISGKDAH